MKPSVVPVPPRRTLRNILSSVRLRLALWNVFVLAFALIGAGALLRQQVASDLFTGVDTSLTNRAPGSGFLDQRRYRPPSPPSDRTRPRRSADRDIFHPHFMNPDGTNFFPDHGGPDRTAEVLNLGALRRSVQSGQPAFVTLETGSSSVYPLRLYTAPIRDNHGDIRAVVQLAAPLAPARQTVAQLTRTLLALIPFALLIAGGGAVFLTDRALRPVRTVTRAAAQIEASDLSARLEVHGDDDFARLADRFNGMLGRLEEAFARREAALEQQRRFVADASHELRTPLTVIKANTSLTLADPDIALEYREVLMEVDAAVDRTIHIAQDLFLLASSDSDQLALDPTDVPLRPLLERVRAEMRRAYPQGAPVSVQVAEEGDSPDGSLAPLTVWGDSSHLQRLITNLAENALRHTPSDGTVRLTARADVGVKSEPKETIVLEVIDSGEGIAPEHLPRVTERFYRVDTARAREQGGTGLGLAICQSIVAAHGGELTIYSKVGSGTTVRITLPHSTSLV